MPPANAVADRSARSGSERRKEVTRGAKVPVLCPICERHRQTPTGEPPVLTRFLHSVVAVSVRTLPGLVVGLLLSMLIVQWLPGTLFAGAEARFAAIGHGGHDGSALGPADISSRIQGHLFPVKCSQLTAFSAFDSGFSY
jgi:hypothetical protein